MALEDLIGGGDDEGGGDEGSPAWMATFADLATLLMTFFVLLLSFANMDAQKFREMLGSVKDAFGVQKETFGDYMARSSTAFDAIVTPQDQGQSNRDAQAGGGTPAQTSPGMEQMLSIVEALFQELQGKAEVFMDEEGITVRVEGKLLFSSGDAALKPEASAVLDRVAMLMGKYAFDLFIVGHTDSVPIETPRYPSNWELSSSRAAAALRYLVAKGTDPKRLVSVGFAESRPIATNGTPEGRAKNRRVEFLFKNPESIPNGGYKPAGP